MNKKIQKIIIAGGGTAGWMTAAALSKSLGKLLDITLIESDEIRTVGVGEATVPPMTTFHKLLGIDEQEFMRATAATFKLGILFENWKLPNSDYIHSFGLTGKSTWLADFHHFWLHGLKRGIASDFGDYCLELQASKQRRFAKSSTSDINYAYHLDASLYAKFLRKFSEANGIKRVEGKIVDVNQHADSGFIESLRLDSGELLEGDLFIDCTGFRGLLIEQTLKTGYEDWTHWLPCDSAIAAQTESVGPPPAYTQATAHTAGWRWRIPLQHRVGNGLVYSSKFMSDDDARTLFLNSIQGNLVNEPHVIKYKGGRRIKAWNKNCVAIGLSSGFVEPLESTSIHLIMMGVTRLLHLFPFNGINNAFLEEYNHLTRVELEQIRDFIVLHYHATEREDSDFWRYCKNMDIPKTLQQRIDLFTQNAHAYQDGGELFRVDSWTQVMFGQGIMPDNYHEFASLMSDRDLTHFFSMLKATIASGVEKLPLHEDFIKQYCAMAK